MKRLTSRLTYANVVATIALFVALGGASYAATRLPRNSVGTRQLKNGAVTGAKIRKGAVTASSLAPGAITQAAIDPASLGTVPRATDAAHATSADSAGHATSADTATRAAGAASAQDAADAATLGGLPPSAFAPADVIRSAVVEDGTVVASESVGITQANLTTVEPGVYCIGGLTPPPVTAVVGNAYGPKEVVADVLFFGVFPTSATCQVQVETRDNTTDRIPGTFAVMIR